MTNFSSEHRSKFSGSFHPNDMCPSEGNYTGKWDLCLITVTISTRAMVTKYLKVWFINQILDDRIVEEYPEKILMMFD